MKICGLKLTHDGAIALIDAGRLVFSIEMEKLSNNARYKSVPDTAIIEELLEQHGYSLAGIDHFAVDGWEGLADSSIATTMNRQPARLSVAPYREQKTSQNVLHPYRFEGLRIGTRSFPYESYMHVTGHLMSAYCTSSFAARGEGAYVLVWDGGMFPRLYYVDAAGNRVHNLGKVFYLIGNFYSEFSMYFDPFKRQSRGEQTELSVAGKVMAYIAKGEVKREIIAHMQDILNNHLNLSLDFVHEFARHFKKVTKEAAYRDEDVLASFHVFLEELLIAGLRDKVGRAGFPDRNLCIVGGCALNIKWNSAIRNTGLFEEVWVPPFPNDSGSAIGAACSSMYGHTGRWPLAWSVYSGPGIIANQPAEGWQCRECSLEALARLLHETGEPVVFLNDKAELGPRALGNRSILAAATSPDMKTTLNEAKKREGYRPVAPICLAERAAEVFSPGVEDPYMLFDHRVRQEWEDRVPAIRHLDGTARVQTVGSGDNQQVYTLLKAYEALSGVPLLCNTSANYNGSGFFPDVYSATHWGGVNYVWCRGQLYYNT